jgi:hypothetical protein
MDIAHKMDTLTESAAAELVSKTAVYGGSGTAVFFGMQAEALAAALGVIIGLAGLAYQIWSGERRLKLLAESRKKNDS